MSKTSVSSVLFHDRGYCAALFWAHLIIKSVSVKCHVCPLSFLFSSASGYSIGGKYSPSYLKYFSLLLVYIYFGGFPFWWIPIYDPTIHIIRVEIRRTRNEVRIPPLKVEPLAGKSGSKGVAAETDKNNTVVNINKRMVLKNRQ